MLTPKKLPKKAILPFTKSIYSSFGVNKNNPLVFQKGSRNSISLYPDKNRDSKRVLRTFNPTIPLFACEYLQDYNLGIKINTDYYTELELEFLFQISNKTYHYKEKENLIQELNEFYDTAFIFDENKLKALKISIYKDIGEEGFNTDYQIWGAISTSYKYKNQYVIINHTDPTYLLGLMDEEDYELLQSTYQFDLYFKFIDLVCETNNRKTCEQVINTIQRLGTEELDQCQKEYFENLLKNENLFVITEDEIINFKNKFGYVYEFNGWENPNDKYLDGDLKNEKFINILVKVDDYFNPPVPLDQIAYGPNSAELCITWIKVNCQYSNSEEEEKLHNFNHDIMDDVDWREETFNALTDGQYGSYDDWLEGGGDMDDLKNSLGY